MKTEQIIADFQAFGKPPVVIKSLNIIDMGEQYVMLFF